MPSPNLNSLFLAGPTAVGKTDVAILLAEWFGAEIISVDSMLVYRGMDIGTAKPSAAHLTRVPHHLIDVTDLSQPFDVSQFLHLARIAESEIRARGRRVLFCGGTGLYFKALLHGLGDSPATDPSVRAELERTPLNELLSELAHRDPATFASIHRENPRRVIRALEVIRVSGRPFSEQRASWQAQANAARTPQIIGLRRAQSDLAERINARVDGMFQAGLVAEVAHLLTRGLAENRNAMQALGYRQAVEYLQGQLSLSEAVDLVKRRTRQFAKRQMTWFKNQLAMEWVDMPGEQSDAQESQVFPQLTLNTAATLAVGSSLAKTPSHRESAEAHAGAIQVVNTETFKRLGWQGQLMTF
jgi:tRNA dimethylallyltransferase